ncbi:MAG: hypothetical protein OXN84_09085, partial [Albidovulum sp.]|nr:hypothetical protein [Albidovulum sp.]
MADPRIVVTTQGARFLGRKFPCSIGRGGVRSEKREGDGATPAGEFALGGILYRPDRIPRNLLPRLARPIGLNWIWSDDPGDPAYNSLVANGFDYPFGHEFMRRAAPPQAIVVAGGVNQLRVTGGGCAMGGVTGARPARG